VSNSHGSTSRSPIVQPSHSSPSETTSIRNRTKPARNYPPPASKTCPATSTSNSPGDIPNSKKTFVTFPKTRKFDEDRSARSMMAKQPRVPRTMTPISSTPPFPSHQRPQRPCPGLRLRRQLVRAENERPSVAPWRSEDVFTGVGHSSEDTYPGPVSLRRKPSQDTTAPRRSEDRELVLPARPQTGMSINSDERYGGMFISNKSMIAEIEVSYGREHDRDGDMGALGGHGQGGCAGERKRFPQCPPWLRFSPKVPRTFVGRVVPIVFTSH